MKPEEKARQDIDQLLTKAGWVIQDVDKINLGAGLGDCIKASLLYNAFDCLNYNSIEGFKNGIK